MAWFVYFENQSGSSYVQRGPYYRDDMAQEKLDSTGRDGFIKRWSTDDPAEAARLFKERRTDDEGVELGIRNLGHKTLR